MNVEELKALSVERFLKRNEELFGFLEDLKDRVPVPIVDFHPEEGELQIKWISQKGMVYLMSTYIGKHSDRGISLTVRWVEMNSWFRKESPTVEEVVDYINQL